MLVGDGAVVAEVQDAEPLEAVGALGHHEVAGERVDVVEAHVGAGARAPSVQCERSVRESTRCDHQREVLGAVGVAEHEEAIARRADVVLDVVLVALHARLDDARLSRRRRRRRRSHTSLVTFDADVMTTKRPLRVRSTAT